MRVLKWILAALAALAAGVAAVFLGRQRVIDQANDASDKRLQARADAAVGRLAATDAATDAAASDSAAEVRDALASALEREPTDAEVADLIDGSK